METINKKELLEWIEKNKTTIDTTYGRCWEYAIMYEEITDYLKGKTMVKEEVKIERAVKDAMSLVAGVPINCPYCNDIINDEKELREHVCKGKSLGLNK